MTDTSDDDRGNFTDGGDVESGDGLHEDQRRLQELLRGAAGGALSGAWIKEVKVDPHLSHAAHAGRNGAGVALRGLHKGCEHSPIPRGKR